MAIAAYEIRETNLTDGGSSVTTVGNVTSYQMVGRTPGKTYRIEVRAVDHQGNESEFSAPVEITLQLPPVTLPGSAEMQDAAGNDWMDAAGNIQY